MVGITIKLDAKAKENIKQKIKKEYGAFASKCVDTVHKEITKRTPVNSGRTLASWNWSFDASIYADRGPFEPYQIGTIPPTNDLPVGAEPGRAVAQALADASASYIKQQLQANPYKTVFITNGASLDSISESTLNQGPGTRAFYQEYGVAPGYDMISKDYDAFFTRGFAMMRQSIEYIKNAPKK